MAADVRSFFLPAGMTAEDVGKAVQQFLRIEKEMEVQGFGTSDDYVVQAKDESTLKNITGLGRALQIRILRSTSQSINVIIGNGKWANKVGAGVIGALVFLPLMLTAVTGAYNQNQLPGEIFESIARYIAKFSIKRTRHRTLKAVLCPACGDAMPVGSKFCARCGTSLEDRKIVECLICHSCGASAPVGAKFCSKCGAKLL